MVIAALFYGKESIIINSPRRYKRTYEPVFYTGKLTFEAIEKY